MKKETIFRHELNESVQAKAAMNCLKNRNNKQVVANQEQEEDYTNDEIPSPNFSYRMSFMVWAMREIIPYLKEISQVCAQADPTELKHAVMKILKTRDTGIPETHHSCKQWAKENYDWVEMELNGEYDAYQKKWSKPFNIPSEQEEHPEDADRLQTQLANAWDEGMEDDEDDYVPYNNTFDETHHDIVENLISVVEHYFNTDDDVNGFYLYNYTEDQLGKAVEKVLDKYGDFPSSNDFNKCYAWAKKHIEEIIKVLETGSLENSYEGHPEFNFSEQEEMEVTDAKLALAQLAADLLHYDDGDLDELYYVISDIIDSEGYCPQTDEYEMWIEEHVNEIEDLIM